MADASTIAGSGLVALAVAAAPKIVELARTWLTRRADVQIAEVKAGAMRAEREASQRIEMSQARTAELSVAERMVLDRADEHRACLEEVAELRGDVAECKEQHAEQRARADAQEARADAHERVMEWMRAKIDGLTAQVERLSRDSGIPPAGEPAE